MSHMIENQHKRERKTVLLADDNPSILDSVQKLLGKLGYRVEVTSDCESLWSGNLPDLLLLDVWMSGVDGRDICRKLKSEERTKNLPVILFSANRDVEYFAREAGADDFIEKPFDLEDLTTKLDKHLAL